MITHITKAFFPKEVCELGSSAKQPPSACYNSFSHWSVQYSTARMPMNKGNLVFQYQVLHKQITKYVYNAKFTAHAKKPTSHILTFTIVSTIFLTVYAFKNKLVKKY